MTKIFSLYVLCVLFGTLQIVAEQLFFDTSNYQILRDPKVTNNFTHFAAKCRGELKVVKVLNCIHDTISLST